MTLSLRALLNIILRAFGATSGHTDRTPCITSTSSCPRMFLVATTSGFRRALAKDGQNTNPARILQPLALYLGDLPQFLAFLQNNQRADSSDTLKVGRAGRYLSVTCLSKMDMCRKMPNVRPNHSK